jgi:hypothetical protein
MVAFTDGIRAAPEIIQLANIRGFVMLLGNVFFNIKGLFDYEG